MDIRHIPVHDDVFVIFILKNKYISVKRKTFVYKFWLGFN